MLAAYPDCTRCLSIIIVPALLLVFSSASATTLQPGQAYQGKTRVESPLTGISFVIPATFTGGYDREAESVVLESERQGMLIGVYGYSEADLNEVVKAAQNLIQKQGIQLSPEKVDQPDERTLEASYQAYTELGPARVHGMARAGEEGNAIAVFALGGGDKGDALKSVVNELLESVQWSDPQAKQWRVMLSGKQLSTSGGDSNYSEGGAGGYGSYASGTNATIDFCSDGSYAYAYESKSYMSIEGMSSERVEEDSHSGEWWLVSDLGGAPTLVLYTTDDRVFYWPFWETEQGVTVDGNAYSVGYSQRCQ